MGLSFQRSSFDADDLALRRLDKEKNVHPKCFDIPIEIEDAFKTKLHSVVQSLEGPAVKEVMAAEDEVARLAQDIRTARQKRDFLNAFA